MLPKQRPTTLAVAVVALAVFAASGDAVAQADPTEHGAHHPGGGAPAPPVPPPAVAPSGQVPMPSAQPTLPAPGMQASGGCAGVMGCMGGSAKPFYAALMDMPSLTPEARRFIEAEAAKRLGSGSAAIAAGQARLHHALSSNDPAAMQRAVAEVREAVLLAQSGAAALLAVNEGQPPRQIALTWFKGQTSVPVADAMAMSEGLWGLSWYHLTTMAFLVAFLLGAILVHYGRLRRISGLVQRLTPGATPPASAPLAAPAAPAAATRKPATAEVAAPGVAPKRWSGALRVAQIFRETPLVKTFRLMDVAGAPIPFNFLPGQFLTFSAEIDGKPIQRSYTIASSPTQRAYVEFTVKREDQGAESRYLHDNVAIGDLLMVSGPSGIFTFTGTETGSIVLISGGVGITPMMCVTRYLTDRNFTGDIFFLYGARTTHDFIFREELEYLRKRHQNLHVVATMERAEETAWSGAEGLISKEFIARAVPDIARRRVHVCGPPPMMEAVKAALAELGVPQDKVKTESFGAAKGAAPAPPAEALAPGPVPAPAPRPAPPSDAEVPSPAPAPAAASSSAPLPSADSATPVTTALTAAVSVPSAQVEVQFSKSGKTGPLAPNQSVLEAAEAIGVTIDFSCRVGTCGICVVPLLAGSVTMAVEDALRPEDKARGIILACQAKSAGALVVEA